MLADDGAEVAVVAVLTSSAVVLGSDVTGGAQKLGMDSYDCSLRLTAALWLAPCMWDLTALMPIEVTLIFFLQFIQ